MTERLCTCVVGSLSTAWGQKGRARQLYPLKACFRASCARSRFGPADAAELRTSLPAASTNMHGTWLRAAAQGRDIPYDTHDARTGCADTSSPLRATQVAKPQIPTCIIFALSLQRHSLSASSIVVETYLVPDSHRAAWGAVRTLPGVRCAH